MSSGVFARRDSIDPQFAEEYRDRMSPKRVSGELPYDSIYRHGFVRVAAAVPDVRLSDTEANAEVTTAMAREAAARNAVIVVFPELGITGYSNDDLFHQDALLRAAEGGVLEIANATRELGVLLCVGLPVRHRHALYNAAAVISSGEVRGIVPKSYLPNYREFYEKRHFAPGASVRGETIRFGGREVPFGPDLLFRVPQIPHLTLHVEICEDIWVPVPPSTMAAFAGATVLANLSASNITIGKADYRRTLSSGQSAKCIAAYIYSAAGSGESTTDLAWDGDAHIHENGRLLVSSERFSDSRQLVTGDVHLDALAQDRMRMTSFQDNARSFSQEHAHFRTVDAPVALPSGEVRLNRPVARFPYVPLRSEARDERCAEAFHIQVGGLVTRIRASGIRKLVIGVSGGLDSTQALLVSCRVADRLGMGRENVLAYTMPGFATSERTLGNARRLMDALGVKAGEIDITQSCMQMFRDIGHPYADGTAQYDTTFENVQAGERTSHLFRLANLNGGLVVGTGDLSELALGWATYGVGDHMSHYGVNVSIPKTLIQYLIRWVADSGLMGDNVREVLMDILDTEISPELIPGPEGGRSEPSQRSEATIGPYELQDFNLYYITRYGLAPSDVLFLAEHAWSDAGRGDWPSGIDEDRRREYSRDELVRWMRVFLTRFFGTTQFKRSCIPNGPKVGSGGSLSPRGDWRAPSDSSPATWLSELDRNVPDAE